MMENNTFTLTFGQSPTSYIQREKEIDQILSNFSLDFPLSHIYIISGVRGSGKTVLLTNAANRFKKLEEWIVIDVNPNRNILEQIASGLYEHKSLKHLFLSTSFSISFKGIGFSIEGKEPVSNIMHVIRRMLNVIRNKKKILITIDEASNNYHMRSFVHDFQTLLREEYPVFTLMTGLYENVNSLQNNRNLTFLYRAPKIMLNPLDLKLIKEEYMKSFPDASLEDIEKITKTTNGYAFAYQVIGYLYSKYKDISKIYDELDTYLSSYVYDKIWESLPEKEKIFLKTFNDENNSIEEIMNKTKYNEKEISVYRDRIIKRGLLVSKRRGELTLALPRFLVYISKQI